MLDEHEILDMEREMERREEAWIDREERQSGVCKFCRGSGMVSLKGYQGGSHMQCPDCDGRGYHYDDDEVN